MILREEHKLQVSGNKVLWKIHGPEKDKISEQLRILYNKGLHGLYRSPRTVRSKRF
jgi:hypothetical protein